MRQRANLGSRLSVQVALIAAFIMASVVMLPAESGDLIADLVLGQYDFTHDGINIVDGIGFHNIGEYDGQRQFDTFFNVVDGDVAVDKSVTPTGSTWSIAATIACSVGARRPLTSAGRRRRSYSVSPTSFRIRATTGRA